MIQFFRDTSRVLGMRCSEHAALMSRAFEQPLTAGERFGLRLHKTYCTGCRRLGKQLAAMHRLMGTLGSDERAEEDIPADVRNRIGGVLNARDR